MFGAPCMPWAWHASCLLASMTYQNNPTYEWLGWAGLTYLPGWVCVWVWVWVLL